MNVKIFVAGIVIALFSGVMLATSYGMMETSEKGTTTITDEEKTNNIIVMFFGGIIILIFGIILILLGIFENDESPPNSPRGHK